MTNTDSNSTLRAAVIGGSGYTGGELARLLMQHPSIELTAITSRRLAGKPIHTVHPNLRGFTQLQFATADDALSHAQNAGPFDVVFLCLPHRRSAEQIEQWLGAARLVVDLSADFRLRSPDDYREWYGEDHPTPERLATATYGLPELHRDDLRALSTSNTTPIVSGVGCNATAMNLALLPLARAGLIERAICDIKVGSSEAGAEPNLGSHHPERAGTVRHYAPAGHRHAAEVNQALTPIQSAAGGSAFTLDVAVTAIELIRGAVCTAHIIPTEAISTKQLYTLFREAYADEPFVRVVRDRAGLHRLPDPKHVAGTNLADVGFDVDERTGRVICIAAIDNLVKGAAGSAIQAANLALGLDETAGLNHIGLHPN
ncbi:MAG: N-acetyl-gamma-glutamyl-phosphate reductase [Planctomycetota bacterium]